MTLTEKMKELAPEMNACRTNDVLDLREDIYYHFSQLDDFEVLRVEKMNDKNCMVKAAILTTMSDPFFKIVVVHKWQTDLAYDNQWHEFDVTEKGIVFRFLTWDESYISGEIWFERVTKDEPSN